MADLCEECGKLHPGTCTEPVTGPPPGLFAGDGSLTRLGTAVEDAANFLAMRGYLDPGAEEWPDWVLAELAGLYQAGPCGTCSAPLNGSDLADHFLARKQDEWERSLPVWTCDCGRGYKVTGRDSWPGGDSFYHLRGDGLLGDLAGSITITTKGKVKHSDACPGCGRRFADTVARQANPQQTLF